MGTGRITRTRIRTRLHVKPIKLKIHRVTPGTIWANMLRKRLCSSKKQVGVSEDKDVALIAGMAPGTCCWFLQLCFIAFLLFRCSFQ